MLRPYKGVDLQARSAEEKSGRNRKGHRQECLCYRRLVGFAEGLPIDAELLALFIEVTAFEAEGAGDVGHVKIVALDFGEQNFFFEGFGAFGESAGGKWGRGRRGTRGGRGFVGRRGYDLGYIGGSYAVFGGKEDQALDYVAEFADVAGPGVAAKFGDGVGGEEFFFPTVLGGDLAGEMGD